jgi:hypothetical protein
MTSRVRDVEGHRVKQVDLVVEGFQLLGPAPNGRGRGLADRGPGNRPPLTLCRVLLTGTVPGSSRCSALCPTRRVKCGCCST